jgi:release factor glutamine methyltransferase
MADEPWTIGRLLNWTTDFLREKGADSPRLDAEVLLAHVRGCKRIELYTAFEEPASDELRQQFRELVKQRAAGKPVAYLVGQREFFSLPFEVTPDVLIPRPETELLVVRALDLAKQAPLTERQDGIQIADIGAGSGILPVTLAKRLPSSRVTAIDVSPAALAVAKRNAEKHGVTDRIEWFESDLFASVPEDRKFDIIVSNPPYIPEHDPHLKQGDLRFEPISALASGPDGLDAIRRILLEAPNHLKHDGWFLLEHGYDQSNDVRMLLNQAGFDEVRSIRDLGGIERVTLGRRQPH